jgi:hypothetical protein
MARAEDYRRYAAECLRVAQQLANPTDKAMLVRMAQKWRELAQKADQSAEGDGAEEDGEC